MTNILKDFWEDRRRGACWLPQDVFTRHGVELAELTPQRPDPGFHAGMRELIGVAHGHLRNALAYTIADPCAGDRHPTLLSVGHRTCRAHPAKNCGQSAIHVGGAGEGLPHGGAYDPVVYEWCSAQRPPAQGSVRLRVAWTAADAAPGSPTGGGSGGSAGLDDP